MVTKAAYQCGFQRQREKGEKGLPGSLFHLTKATPSKVANVASVTGDRKRVDQCESTRICISTVDKRTSRWVSFFRPFRVIAADGKRYSPRSSELRGAYAVEVGKDVNSSRYVVKYNMRCYPPRFFQQLGIGSYMMGLGSRMTIRPRDWTWTTIVSSCLSARSLLTGSFLKIMYAVADTRFHPLCCSFPLLLSVSLAFDLTSPIFCLFFCRNDGRGRWP